MSKTSKWAIEAMIRWPVQYIIFEFLWVFRIKSFLMTTQRHAEIASMKHLIVTRWAKGSSRQRWSSLRSGKEATQWGTNCPYKKFFLLKTDNIIGCSGSGRSSDSRESLLDDGDKQNSVGFSIAPEKPQIWRTYLPESCWGNCMRLWVGEGKDKRANCAVTG